MKNKTVNFQLHRSLIARARNNDHQAWIQLVSSVEPILRGLTGKYYLPDGDEDDVRAVALAALVEAVRNFRGDRGDFLRFASTCMERRVRDSVTRSNRNKNLILTESLKRAAVDDDSEPITSWQAAEGSASQTDDIVERLHDRQVLRELVDPDSSSRFSANELMAARGRLLGYSHEAIAAHLGESIKGVDNALQRARRKMVA